MDLSRTKLIFLDVDGVIARDYFTDTNKEMLDSISKLMPRYNISLCTGRSYIDSKKIIDGAGLIKQYHVLSSGTVVTKPGGGFEYKKYLSRNEADELIELTSDLMADVGVGIFADDVWNKSLDETNSEKIFIVSLNSDSDDGTDNILQRLKPLKAKYNFSVLNSSFYKNGAHIHVTPKGITKGYGALYVMDKLGLKKNQVLGVGDSAGDLPFLNECGIKVIMGNAKDDVKAHGDLVIDTFDNHGLVRFIEEELLR